MPDYNAIHRFLADRGHETTAIHCREVAEQARALALRFGVDADRAYEAGLLHDISAVIPNDQRLNRALAWGVPILPEERVAPMILHQKLSAVMARRQFGVTDASVLSAIGCHTTLKPDASPLDKVVFVADKIAWDQPGTPPWRDDLARALDVSLDAAALTYLDYLWERREQLLVVHPWFVAARAQLSKRLSPMVSSRQKLSAFFRESPLAQEASALDLER